jgi:hypothetical protein
VARRTLTLEPIADRAGFDQSMLRNLRTLEADRLVEIAVVELIRAGSVGWRPRPGACGRLIHFAQMPI